MAKKPKLSIIIVSYNTKKLLRQCLKSISADLGKDSTDYSITDSKKNFSHLSNNSRIDSDRLANYEIIIIDNASTDGSIDMLRSFVSSISTIRIVEMDRNYGFAKAVSRGIKEAKGEYILLLNSDIVCLPGSIEKLVKFAKSAESVGLIGGQLLNPDKTPQASVYHFPTARRAFQEFWLGQKGAYDKYLPQTQKPVAVDCVVGAVMLIPKETVDKVGFFDENYFLYFEDFDYCRRVRQAGLKVYYLPQAEFIHYHGQSGKRQPKKISKYLVQSSKIYFGWFRHYLINLVIWTGQKFSCVIQKGLSAMRGD